MVAGGANMNIERFLFNLAIFAWGLGAVYFSISSFLMMTGDFNKATFAGVVSCSTLGLGTAILCFVIYGKLKKLERRLEGDFDARTNR